MRSDFSQDNKCDITTPEILKRKMSRKEDLQICSREEDW